MYTHNLTDSELRAIKSYLDLRILKIVAKQFRKGYAFRDVLTSHIDGLLATSHRCPEHETVSIFRTQLVVPFEDNFEAPELRYEHQDFQDAIEQAIKLEAMHYCLCSTDITEPLCLTTILTNLEPKQAEYLDSVPAPVVAYIHCGDTEHIMVNVMAVFLDTAQQCLLDETYAPKAADCISRAHQEIYENHGHRTAFERLYNHVAVIFKFITP